MWQNIVWLNVVDPVREVVNGCDTQAGHTHQDVIRKQADSWLLHTSRCDTQAG